MLTWVLASYLHRGKVSVIGAATGAVAGLVAITPAAGFVGAGGAVLIGLGVGALCYGATLLRERLRVDDALDVFAVHGVGGIFGALATGVLAAAAIGGVSGALEGNLGQVGVQAVAVGATAAFAALATLGIVKLVELVAGLRVEPQAEQLGLDLAVHGEAAYQL
jgi:Amt family ammonium transporter